MVIFFLIPNASGAKGPLSARKPRIRENQKFTSRTLPRLRGGLLKTRVVLPEKNIGSGQTSGSMRITIIIIIIIIIIISITIITSVSENGAYGIPYTHQKGNFNETIMRTTGF